MESLSNCHKCADSSYESPENYLGFKLSIGYIILENSALRMKNINFGY